MTYHGSSTCCVLACWDCACDGRWRTTRNRGSVALSGSGRGTGKAKPADDRKKQMCREHPVEPDDPKGTGNRRGWRVHLPRGSLAAPPTAVGSSDALAPSHPDIFASSGPGKIVPASEDGSDGSLTRRTEAILTVGAAAVQTYGTGSRCLPIRAVVIVPSRPQRHSNCQDRLGRFSSSYPYREPSFLAEKPSSNTPLPESARDHPIRAGYIPSGGRKSQAGDLRKPEDLRRFSDIRLEYCRSGPSPPYYTSAQCPTLEPLDLSI